MNCHFLFDDFWMISECFLMLHVVGSRYAAMPLCRYALNIPEPKTIKRPPAPAPQSL